MPIRRFAAASFPQSSALLAAVVLLGLTGCDVEGLASAPTTTASPTPGVCVGEACGTTLPALPRESLGACVDRSNSVPDHLSYDTLDQLAAALVSVVPAPQPTTGVGAAILPTREYQVRVRTIGADSFAPESELLNSLVPGAPGIGAPPDPSSDVTSFAIWRRAVEDVVGPATQLAHDAALSAASSLQGLRNQIPVASRSEIDGCISAFAQSSGGDRRLVVASDLEAYGPVDQVGDATALRILVIQYCDDSAVECEERAAAFVSTWEGRGAAVRVVRPEDAAAEIATLVREV